MKARRSIVVLAWRLATMAALGSAIPATACVNSFRSDLVISQSEGNEKEVARIIAELEEDFKKDPSLEHGNDLAVGRLLTQRYDEAIALLQETERRFPGKAIVAANLGTALELKGDDVTALSWIKEGVRRDPKEHVGSEWLHVRILEAKLALAKDPTWLEKNTVLGVDFGTDVRPRAAGPMPVDESGAPRSNRSVESSLLYQANERRQFVKAPDAVVADLYAALGDLEFASFAPGVAGSTTGSIADPTRVYEYALQYGAARAALVQRRLHAVNEIYRANIVSAEADHVVVEPEGVYLADGWAPSAFSPGVIIAGLVIGIGGAWWWRRQSRIKRP